MKYRALAMCVIWLLGLGQAFPKDLYDYYRSKYPTAQTRLYDQAARLVFPQGSVDEQQQAREEAAAVNYVVLHRTRSHDVANNVAVTHAWRRYIEQSCRQFDVPPAMAFAILTWENSGSTQAMSGAARAGIGQMSSGAVTESHMYASTRAIPSVLSYRFCRLLRATLAGLSETHTVAYRHARRGELYWFEQATKWQTVAHHRGLAMRAKVADERMLPPCNVEDSVLFMRILLDAFDDRIALAISAYHNGQRNTDDLLRDYLRRMDPQYSAFTGQDRQPLFAALRERHIDYLTLWNDHRCREMLNGLRTMDGYVTDDSNRSEALGDESDIYVWKTTAALAAFLASPGQLAALEGRYQGHQEDAEMQGWKPATKLKLVPELVGYLAKLKSRLRDTAGPKAVLVTQAPVRGVAINLSSSATVALAALLNEDWLFDRIYLTHQGAGHWHICLNPRFGREYTAYLQQTARR